MGAGKQSRNAGSFLRKELGEALRNTENKQRPDAVPPSPDGATRWPGFKVFALCAGYAHTRARLRNPLQDFCLGKGAINCGGAATFPLSGSEHNLSLQPAAAGGHNLQPRRGWPSSPLNPVNLLNPLNPFSRTYAPILRRLRRHPLPWEGG